MSDSACILKEQYEPKSSILERIQTHPILKEVPFYPNINTPDIKDPTKYIVLRTEIDKNGNTIGETDSLRLWGLVNEKRSTRVLLQRDGSRFITHNTPVEALLDNIIGAVTYHKTCFYKFEIVENPEISSDETKAEEP